MESSAKTNGSYKYFKAVADGRIDVTDVETLEGVALAPGVTAARISGRRQRMVLRPDDVFVATYPKSGTTWMQHIVKLVANNGEENGIDNDAYVPWIDVITDEEIAALPSPRFMKTHIQYKLMPGGGDPENTCAKYIYVMRNPKDTCVSFFHYLPKILPFSHHEPWDSFFERFLDGKQLRFGPFYDHIAGWWVHKDAPNILIVKYEELVKDLRSGVVKIAEFLGYNLSANVIDKIVSQTTFANMRNNEIANKDSWETVQNHVKFMRKGVVGDWQNHFSDEQSARMDTVIAEKLGSIGVEFD